MIPDHSLPAVRENVAFSLTVVKESLTAVRLEVNVRKK
jgi:hypothetical protein